MGTKKHFVMPFGVVYTDFHDIFRVKRLWTCLSAGVFVLLNKLIFFVIWAAIMISTSGSEHVNRKNKNDQYMENDLFGTQVINHCMINDRMICGIEYFEIYKLISSDSDLN